MLIRSFGLIFAATTAAAAAIIHPNECIHEVYRFLCLGIMIGICGAATLLDDAMQARLAGFLHRPTTVRHISAAVLLPSSLLPINRPHNFSFQTLGYNPSRRSVKHAKGRLYSCY